MFNVTLKSDNLIIRPMKRADLPFFVELRNKCARWLHDNRKFKLGQARAWFVKTPLRYYIIEKDGARAGYLRTSEWDPVNDNMYIGADIHPSFRRKGIAKEAYQMFMDFLFKKKKFNKVSLEVLDFNTPAISLYKKLGFKVEGVRRKHIKRKTGYVDSIIMAIRRSEYAQK